MATTFQIAEVAKRPGFALTTVRYYVDIGLHTREQQAIAVLLIVAAGCS